MTKCLLSFALLVGLGCNGTVAVVDGDAAVGANAEFGGAGAHSGDASSGGTATLTTSGLSSWITGGSSNIGGSSAALSGTYLHHNTNPYDAGFELGTPTPGTVACANSTCPALSHPQQNNETESYCCVGFGLPTTQMCFVNRNLGACESGSPILYCDDASECDPGLVCCGSARGGIFACHADCTGGAQICKTDDECKNGMKCVGPLNINGWVGGSCQ